MEGNPNTELVNALQTQMESLKKRIRELETENAKLSIQLSKCVCRKIIVSDETRVLDCTHSIEEMEGQKSDENDVKNRSKEKVPDTHRDTMALHHLPKRHIALKVMYFGQRFYGFASEAQMDPTIEKNISELITARKDHRGSTNRLGCPVHVGQLRELNVEIFKALQKTRLISGDKKEMQYSRCGRTDKGVSSVGQVISLFLRSNLKETARNNGYSGESFAEESCGGEIDYVKILNRVLPRDIRVIGWSPAPTDFSARFSCLSREYKYFFWRESLNIMAMEIAGKKFIGEHDFRNFCKMDAANVHNYRRHITLFDIFPCNERFEDDELWAVKIKDNEMNDEPNESYKCTTLLGDEPIKYVGLALPGVVVIDELLDIERTPRKPQYTMAPEIPLVLRSCEFEGLKFKCSSDARQALRTHLEKECRSYKLQAAIYHEAVLKLLIAENIQLNSGRKKKEAAHIPLMSRPTEPTYEERRAKLNAGGGSKKIPAVDT
ncbi:hypothetical protein DH2020_008370 [Rehmannia glutinosa]|uniref:tRNA pseudouridine synthase n=1 Tax=Rehmannia glutinosa TaxID=99300 RepID=A0ABR0U1D0_REHGL